jgi:uncharacterized protein (DUF1684 family)
MTNRALFHVVPMLAGALIAGCTTGGVPPADTRPYAQRIAEWRTARDEAFKSTAKESGSPIPIEQRPSFAGLTYYSVDASSHVPAELKLEVSNPPVIIELQTSTAGERDKYMRVGWLHFTLNGEPYKLVAFAENQELTRLFVPFGDLTNGSETYRGGRFLDLDRTATGIYDLDFNRAYNPNCVYSPSWTCPLPPRENKLPVAVRAGERLGPSAHH